MFPVSILRLTLKLLGDIPKSPVKSEKFTMFLQLVYRTLNGNQPGACNGDN